MRGAVAALALVLGVVACADDDPLPRASGGRLNLLVIVADDLGFHDLGVYGSTEVRTPNLDRLAASGSRFTRFYAAGDVCAPTRASLLTGLYPQRLGFRGMPRGLPAEVVTLPELLRQAGYATHHVGKWHLGHEPAAVLPLAQGYESFFGFLHHFFLQRPTASGGLRPPTYHDPMLVTDGDEALQHAGHLTDLLTAHAVRRVWEGARRGPWLLNLWYFAPHSPGEPPARWARHYPDDARGRYHALVSTLDEGVGRVLGALERTGQLERTAIVLLSDNGAAEPRSNHPLLGTKTQFFEGGVRVPLIVRLPSHAGPPLIDAVTSSLDLYPTLAALGRVRPPEPLDGRSLLPLLEQPPRPLEARPLFWENTAYAGPWARGLEPRPFEPRPPELSPLHDFSVLSADGRLRLTKEGGGLALFDLAEDPTGHANVASAQPGRVAEMTAMYRAWARETRRIPVRVVARGEARWDGASAHLDGGPAWIEVAGWDVARTPGAGDWSFAVGLERARRGGGKRVVARQEDAWSLTVSGRQITATVGEQALGARLPAGRCVAVILSVVVPQGLRRPGKAFMEMYLDGRRAGRKPLAETIPGEALAQPTFLGGDGDARTSFAGTLRQATFYNVRLGEAEAAELSAALCGDGPDVVPAAAAP